MLIQPAIIELSGSRVEEAATATAESVVRRLSLNVSVAVDVDTDAHTERTGITLSTSVRCVCVFAR
jgi:hypothetical protein